MAFSHCSDKLTMSQSDFFEPWLEYQQPIVRQLAFCIASPSILAALPSELPICHAFQLHNNSHWQQHYQNYVTRLKALDHQPQPLLDFLAKLKSTRLGLRFEHLVWFWLKDHAFHPYLLLGHSIQKIDGARTLGELDFVLFNEQTKEIEHWEVALKYYLAEADFSLAHWYGLNRSDTLQRKLLHFTNRQFQFKHACDHTIQKRFAMFKGQLYLPSHTQDLSNMPSWVNTARRLGIWGYQIPESTEFYRLQRHEWICPEQTVTSTPNPWWTDGLYRKEDQYYMFRRQALLAISQKSNLP